MFTPKLIVTDLDGTALKNNKDIADETIAAFENCRKKAFMLPLQLRDISEVLHITQINFMLISRYLQTEHLYIRTVNLYIPGQCL